MTARSNRFDFDLRHKQGRRRAAAAAGVGMALMMAAPLSAFANGAPTDVSTTTDTSCTPYKALGQRVEKNVAEFIVEDGSCPVKITFSIYGLPDGKVLPFENQILFDSKTDIYNVGLHTVTLNMPVCGFQSDLYFGDLQHPLIANVGNHDMLPMNDDRTPYDYVETDGICEVTTTTQATTTTTTTTTTRPTTTTVPVTIATTTTTMPTTTTTTTVPVTTTTIPTTTTVASTTTVPVTIASTIPSTTVATTVPATTPSTVAVLGAVQVKGAVLAKTGLPVGRMMTFAGSLMMIGTGMLSLASRRRRVAGL